MTFNNLKRIQMTSARLRFVLLLEDLCMNYLRDFVDDNTISLDALVNHLLMCCNLLGLPVEEMLKV